MRKFFLLDETVLVCSPAAIVDVSDSFRDDDDDKTDAAPRISVPPRSLSPNLETDSTSLFTLLRLVLLELLTSLLLLTIEDCDNDSDDDVDGYWRDSG